MLWTAPSPASASLTGGAAAAPQSDVRDDPDRAGVVGYCMMTFVIRNGLPALSLGLTTYLGYVASLTRGWGLTRRQAGQVDAFARAWAAWIGARGGADVLPPARYLDQAEPFAAAFLAGGGDGRGLGTEHAEGAFQGLLVLMETPAALVPAVKAALQIGYEIDPAKIPPYSKQMVAQVRRAF